jgi:hypothetical protein
MNAQQTARSLVDIIDRHAFTNQPTGTLESHDLASLGRRVLTPQDMLETLLASGTLKAEHPVRREDPAGLQSFKSDLLNDVRYAVLFALVESVIDQADTGDQALIAAGEALNRHVASFRKPAGEPTQLHRFPDRLVQFARPYDADEPSAVSTAAKVAGTGALAYGAASYLRGRAPGRTAIDALKAGHAANVADLTKARQFLRPRLAKAATVGADLLGSASAGARKVGQVLAGRIPRAV